MRKVWASLTLWWCLFWHRDDMTMTEDETEIYCGRCGREWRQIA